MQSLWPWLICPCPFVLWGIMGVVHSNISPNGLICACSVVSVCDPMDCNLRGSSCLWDFPGKNIGVGCHFLVQGLFLTQGSCISCVSRKILYHCVIWVG